MKIISQAGANENLAPQVFNLFIVLKRRDNRGQHRHFADLLACTQNIAGLTADPGAGDLCESASGQHQPITAAKSAPPKQISPITAPIASAAQTARSPGWPTRSDRPPARTGVRLCIRTTIGTRDRAAAATTGANIEPVAMIALSALHRAKVTSTSASTP